MLSSGDEITKKITIPDPNKRNHFVYSVTSLREFRNTTSIWGNTLSFLGLSNDFERTYSVDSDVTVADGFSPLPPTSFIAYMFYVEDMMFEVTVEPDTLLVAFTKIGAIIGLAKCFFFLNSLHEWQFEKKLAREYTPSRVAPHAMSINDNSIEEA